MSNYSTDADILEYEPTIKEFGVIDFSAEHTKTTADIQRHLRIEWWPRVSRASTTSRYFNSTNLEMDITKLDSAQLNRAAVYHCLSFYIYDFDGDGTVEEHEEQPAHFNRLVR